MFGFSFVPIDDPQQAHRIRRFFIAALTSLLVLYFMGVVHIYGYLALRGLQLAAAGMLLCFVVLYGVFRSGLNMKCRDPSLTSVQMVCALVVTLLAAYYTASIARSVFLPVVLMCFYFGVYRLDTSKMVSIALLAIAGYGIMIATLFFVSPCRSGYASRTAALVDTLRRAAMVCTDEWARQPVAQGTG